MDMDVTLDAKRVLAPAYLPVQAIAARVQVENGQALVRSLDMTFGGGKITGDLAVDARTDNPATRVNLRVQDVDLAAFFRGSRFFDTTEGKLRGPHSVGGKRSFPRSGHGHGQRRCCSGDGRRISQWTNGQPRQSAHRHCPCPLHYR